MSKLARQPIKISDNVTVAFEKNIVKVSGTKGNLSFEIPEGIKAEIADGKILVSQEKAGSKETRPSFGLTRSLLFNMVKGVDTGFQKKLELSGVGYRAQASGNTLTLFVGFSHPVVISDPDVTFEVAENVITVSGIDKIKVGNVAAKVREVRPPEPYKGKGIKFQDEKIRRKAGKAAKALGAAVPK